MACTGKTARLQGIYGVPALFMRCGLPYGVVLDIRCTIDNGQPEKSNSMRIFFVNLLILILVTNTD